MTNTRAILTRMSGRNTTENENKDIISISDHQEKTSQLQFGRKFKSTTQAAATPALVLENKPLIRARHISYPIYSLYATNIIANAADMFMSLSKTLPLPYRKDNLPFIITAVSAAIFYEITTSGSIKDNIKRTYFIIKNKKFSNNVEDWPELSSRKEILAMALILFIGLWDPFSNSVQAYFFVNAFPENYELTAYINLIAWIALSVIISLGAGTITITGIAESYQTIRDRLANFNLDFTNYLSLFLSPILGISFGFLESVQKMVQAYSAIKNTFQIEELSHKILLAAPNVLMGTLNFILLSTFYINAIDNFFDWLKKREVHPLKIFSFGLTLGLSIYLSYFKMDLNDAFARDMAADVFDEISKLIPDEYFVAFIWSTFGQDSFQHTLSLLDFMHDNIVSPIANRTAQCLTTSAQYFTEASNTTYEYIQDFSHQTYDYCYGLSTNLFNFFSSPTPTEIASEQPLESDFGFTSPTDEFTTLTIN